jgi:hypothetical protein
MNVTLAPDWDFHERARALWHEQVLAYGEQRLQRDADSFEELRRLLVAACNGERLEERGRRDFVPACVFNSGQPDCARQRRALGCMLRVYDACRGSRSGGRRGFDARVRRAGRRVGNASASDVCRSLTPLDRSLALP